MEAVALVLIFLCFFLCGVACGILIGYWRMCIRLAHNPKSCWWEFIQRHKKEE